MDFKKITPKPVEQMPTADIMRNVFEGEPSDQSSSNSGDVQPQRQRRTIDIEAIQKIKPTATHLEAEALRTSFYKWREGAERISKDDFNAAKLIKQLNDIRMYGTDKPNKEIQQVRYQVRDQRVKDVSANIEGLISTDIYAMTAYLYGRDYKNRAGMTWMVREYSEQVDLSRQIRPISTLLRRRKEMQKAMIRALRRRVRRQTPKGKQRAMQDELSALQEQGEMKPQEIAPAEPLAYEIGMENYLPCGEEKPHQLQKAPQQHIQEYMNSQEMEVVTEQIAFMMYIESFRDGGEEGLRQLQHDFPETYKIAIRHVQRMREQGDRSEQ